MLYDRRIGRNVRSTNGTGPSLVEPLPAALLVENVLAVGFNDNVLLVELFHADAALSRIPL